jgi:hypothetical protein
MHFKFVLKKSCNLHPIITEFKDNIQAKAPKLDAYHSQRLRKNRVIVPG